MYYLTWGYKKPLFKVDRKGSGIRKPHLPVPSSRHWFKDLIEQW
jgi:hypothetical protein